ncbi:MAG TPA: methyltransferase domain-containing protein [Xanthomonadaceae bacterium]|nr:methyltransferase domain-containing protein [Xanthomonadaceae bacterium]
MPKIAAFEAHAERYEDWFTRNEAAYLSELLAVRAFLPWSGRGLEIGVGSGRFAAPLGIQVGVDPSPAMLALAAARGIEVVVGTAEQLPFPPARFDYALIVTTLCFVDSPARMLAEAHRVLEPNGSLVIGFIDRDSPLGRDYLAHQARSVFYREATFYSAAEVEQLLGEAGFTIHAWGQTLSHSLAETCMIEPLQSGRGRCSFVVVSAGKGPSTSDR